MSNLRPYYLIIIRVNAKILISKLVPTIYTEMFCVRKLNCQLTVTIGL